MRNGNIPLLVGMIISVASCSLLCHEVDGKNIIPRQPSAVNKEMQEKILNKDFTIAKKALDENKKQRWAIAIRMSLKNQSLIIRQQAADALKELQDKPSVPDLIEALENNQVRYTGGSETQLMQSELNKSLLSALQTLTGLDLIEGRELTTAQIQKAIQECKNWWNKNKDRIR
jgi:hypothetical protein